jgi:hypothetical protein
MAMAQLQDITAKIFSLVDLSPKKTLLGVPLGILLRIDFPEFSAVEYGCRNLRQFIRLHVPRVIEVGRSGTDIFYTTASQPVVQPPVVASPNSIQSQRGEFVPLPTSGYNWKAYSNPSHPFVLIANRDNGELQVVGENQSQADPWVAIPKPSTEAHREIAKNFVGTQAGPLRDALERLLLDSKWYVQFSDAAKRAGVGPQWAVFRRKALIEKFNESLRNFHIPVSASSRSTAFPASSTELKRSHAVPATDEAVFRELVKRLVAELPISELRSLRLPVGLVFDALKG